MSYKIKWHANGIFWHEAIYAKQQEDDEDDGDEEIKQTFERDHGKNQFNTSHTYILITQEFHFHLETATSLYVIYFICSCNVRAACELKHTHTLTQIITH